MNIKKKSLIIKSNIIHNSNPNGIEVKHPRKTLSDINTFLSRENQKKNQKKTHKSEMGNRNKKQGNQATEGRKKKQGLTNRTKYE